jgi:hypothetical protein
MTDEQLVETRNNSRRCDTCGELYPLHKDYYAPTGNGDTFGYVCMKCRKRKEAEEEIQKIEEDAMDRLRSLPLSGGNNIPHTAELLEGAMVAFGGTAGFSNLLLKQYLDAKPGSRIRSGILEMVTRLASKNTEVGGAKKPTELMSEEELEAEIELRLKNAVTMFGGNRKVVVDVENDTANLDLPNGRVEELASGVERAAIGVAAAIQADTEARNISQKPFE